ncbi:MAG TPA: hypothetical protein VFF73_42330, partial [Planctomycetota bacterium]|nr:hypothetical protein [Planctomycetota bacterium]
MRRLALPLLLVALIAGKAFSDDWYLTYVASRLGGLDDGEARVVASASSAVDDSPALTRLLARANAIKGEPTRLLEVLPRWHATSGDLAKRRDELAQRAVSGNDLVALGQLAHFVVAARAHQGRGLSFLGPLVGARETELVSDPARAEQAAADALEAVRAFAEKTGRKAAASPDAAKLMKLSVEALARAASEGLGDAATEKLLDQALEEGKAGFAVAPSRERLRYAFDAKGDVKSIDLEKDLPPLALATDDAATRALQGALADAAAAGSLPVPSTRDLLETYRALEGIHLGATLVEQIDARLAQLRGRTEGLDAKVAAAKRELASVDEEIAAAQKRYDKLTKLDEGPCACGAPTHRQCKTPEACEKVEGAQAAREKELIDKAKARRGDATKAVEAAEAEQKALAAEIKAWNARAAALAAETRRELPEDLRKRVAYGATLTPTIRGALGKL